MFLLLDLQLAPLFEECFALCREFGLAVDTDAVCDYLSFPLVCFVVECARSVPEDHLVRKRLDSQH